MPGPLPEASLRALQPDLVSQWHPNRNDPLVPEQFFPQSNRVVWWLCSKGHEWKAAISTRAKGIGCPYCSGRLATHEKNLSKLRPDVAVDWHPDKNHPLEPKDFTPFSHKRVWWRCQKGHEWQSTIANRIKSRGCPYCLGIRASSERNLAILHPDLSREWYYEKNISLKPEEITPGSGKKVWWRCV